VPERYPASLWGAGLTRKRILVLAGILIVAFVLAFALQDVVRLVVVIPLAYLWWALGLVFGVIPGVVLWGGMLTLVVIILFNSLTTGMTRPRTAKEKKRPQMGNVEGLATAIEKAHEGVYMKWKLANRLGNLARDWLIQRGDRDGIKDIGPLTGHDWHPSAPVDAYLDAGLRGSFADYPTSSWPFKRPQATPLDLNVSEVVEFLEAQMENHGRR